MDQRGHDRGENDGVDPFVDRLVGLALLAEFGVVAPHVAVEEARDVEVVNHHEAQKQPQVARPDVETERVEQRGEREDHPFVAQNRLVFIHHFVPLPS